MDVSIGHLGLALLWSLAITVATTRALSSSNGHSHPCNISSLNLIFKPEKSSPIIEGSSISIQAILPIGIAEWANINVTSSDQLVTKIENLTVKVNDTAPDSVKRYRPNVHSTSPLVHNLTECFELFSTSPNANTILDITVQGLRLGESHLIVSIDSNASKLPDHPGRQGGSGPAPRHGTADGPIEFAQTYSIVVLRDVGLDDKIFHIVIQVLLAIINFAFGCELDLAIVVAYMKKPLAPCLGFCSQFLFMPLLGLAIAEALNMDPVFGLGLISLACAPGGGASNAWTVLLGGDINLSLTMTFMSLTLALGMMPLWMFIVSRLFLDPSIVRIPYLTIFTTLCYFVCPCFVGVILKKVKPKFAQPMTKLIKPLSIIFLLWILTLGTYVNLYMWRLMGEVPLTIAAGILLPWCGFAFGFILSIISRQERQRAIAISIETGIQNMGVPIVLLQRSFPQPQGDIAATMVNSVGIFTPLPLFVALIAITIHRRCANRKETKNRVQIQIVAKDDVEDCDSSLTLVKESTTPTAAESDDQTKIS